MNNRIKELAGQATTIEVISGRGFDTTQYTSHFDKEKFAELILKECLLYAKDGDIDFMKFMIKKHFGVE